MPPTKEIVKNHALKKLPGIFIDLLLMCLEFILIYKLLISSSLNIFVLSCVFL